MRIASLFTAALLGAASTPAGAQVLTLGEAQRLALVDQPSLRALQHSARAAQHSALADSALPDPRLKLGALNFPVSGFPSAREDMTQLGVSWEQSIPGGDKQRLRSERAHAEAGQMFAESHSLMQSIQRDVGFAWVEAWLALAAQRLAGELEGEYERAADLARIAVASGRGSQAEALAARQLRAQAADRRMEFAIQAERARGALGRWVPEASSRPLLAEPPALEAPAPLQELRSGLGTHPQHETHALAQGVADAEVALAREASKPDRTIEVGYYARSGGRSDMLMFQIAFELPMYAERKQDRALEAKLRLAGRAREQRADHLRQLHAELDAAHAEWRLAGERLVNLRAAILPQAQSRLEALQAQHSAGGTGLGAVFEARRALLEARVQELQLIAAQAKARVGLAYYGNEGGHR